jgi:hypothetical protein
MGRSGKDWKNKCKKYKQIRNKKKSWLHEKKAA